MMYYTTIIINNHLFQYVSQMHAWICLLNNNNNDRLQIIIATIIYLT